LFVNDVHNLEGGPRNGQSHNFWDYVTSSYKRNLLYANFKTKGVKNSHFSMHGIYERPIPFTNKIHAVIKQTFVIFNKYLDNK
jgi:hypothetical protein